MLAAVALTDMLAAQIFYADESKHRKDFGLKEKEDDTHFRQKLCAENEDFWILRDLAKAQKHAVLTQGNVQNLKVGRADQVTGTPGIFHAPFGTGVFQEAQVITVELNDGSKRNVLSVVEGAINFLTARFP